MIGFTQRLRAHPTKLQLVVTPKAEASLKAEKQKLQTMLSGTTESLVEGWEERDSPSEDETREIEFSHHESIILRLQQIDEALQRIGLGTYGRCLACGVQIKIKRLAADYAAPLCLACQIENEG